ncbi:hypothetical protein MJO29_010053 [Puccinia striiformis f. sp. tritici]|nr:hypothetical protein MJO29_010053 [Puccinia striiformis f. sp. tritici]
MLCVLFVGMIATLCMTVANAHICSSSLQTAEGGWSPPDGKATCDDGSRTYVCDLAACKSGSPDNPTDFEKKTLAAFFTGCSKDFDNPVGTLSVYVLSYNMFDGGILSVTGKNYPSNKGGLEVYCKDTPENIKRKPFCDDARCNGGSSHVHPELTGNDKRVPGTKSNKKMKSSQISKQVGRWPHFSLNKKVPRTNRAPTIGHRKPPSFSTCAFCRQVENHYRTLGLHQAATARQIKTNFYEVHTKLSSSLNGLSMNPDKLLLPSLRETCGHS